MNAPTEIEMLGLSTALVVISLTYSLVKFTWKYPLRNGPEFFMGCEVPTGFYDGPGRTWLKSYQAIQVALHLVLGVALGTAIALRRWDLTPLCCGAWALLYVATILIFTAWTRRKLGANPPVRPVALALESRRLGDYISWPLEALMFAMVAVSWWLLLSAGETRIKWLYLLYLIWFVLGLLTCKIALIRFSYPLPAERTAEHYRYQDAERRTWIRVVNVLSWFLVFVLLSIALRHTRSLARMEPGLQWFVRGAALALGGSCIFMAFRGIRQLTEMGRDLRPVGSWATPFRASSMWITVSRAYQIWFAVWFGVLLVMILFLCFR